MARQPYRPISQDTGDCVTGKDGKCQTHDKWCRAIISKEPGNSAQNLPDGLFVPAIIYRENTFVESGNDAVGVVEGQTEQGYRSFAVSVRLDAAPGNEIVMTEDGLRVEFPDPEENPVLFMHEGFLTYTPLLPGRGVINYTEDRSFIRITNNLTRIVLPPQEEFERFQELLLVQDIQREVPFRLVWGPEVVVDNVVGPSERMFAPGASLLLLRHTGNQWLVIRGGGVGEAPADNMPYVRKNGQWVRQHDEVLPVLVTGVSADPMGLPVANQQFNHIVMIDESFTNLVLRRQYIGSYKEKFEATYIKASQFSLEVPIGVTVNNVQGPNTWIIEGRPKGAVLKQVFPDNWLLLGSASRDPAGAGLPPITVLEFPGSGTFKASVKMLDGTMLYDMTNNVQMFNSINALKNIIVGMVIVDLVRPVIDNKDVVYLEDYGTEFPVTKPLSGLQHEDIISWRDALKLLMMGGHEDIVVMAALLLGEELNEDNMAADAMSRFNLALIDKVAEMENPLLSAFYAPTHDVEDPPAQTNVYKLIDWFLTVERDYPELKEILNLDETSFMVFGPNDREVEVQNLNEYLVWPFNHFGLKSEYSSGNTHFGMIQKHEMGSGIPVFISMLGFTNEFYRHLAYTSVLMHLEDDFPFLSGSPDFDPIFTNVTLLLGNSVSLIDRSNVANQVSLSPVGIVQEVRDNKAWIRSYDLNGTTGWIGVFDNPSLRLHDQDFTIEFIFRGKGLKGFFNLFSKYTTDGNRRSYKLVMDSNNLKFIYSFNGTTDEEISVSIVDQNVFLNGARRNVTIQRVGNLLGLFINGRLMHEPVDIGENSFHNCDMPLAIGVDNNPLDTPSPSTNHFGLFKFDNMRITKGVARYPMADHVARTVPFRTGSGA